MPSTMLHVTVRSKRMLTRREAAEHCGRSIKRFAAECPVRPIVFENGDERFDVQDLDAWLDSLKNSDSSDAEQIVARLPRK
jgi:hypothetical protein